nr:MAG TPA: hypothetical protein [Caudoviricetes sp.]
MISVSLTLLRSQPRVVLTTRREGSYGLPSCCAPGLLVRAVSCARGLTCCKARRRPLDLSPVSRTGKGLKSSQIGLQRV